MIADEQGGRILTCNEGLLGTFIRTDKIGGVVETYNKDRVKGTLMRSTEKGGGIATYNKSGALGTAMASIDEGGGN
jgi:hypothetical protein